MPYKSFKTEGKYEREDFVHIYTNTTLAIDLWRPSQPNNKVIGEICIKSYFGNKFNNSLKNIIGVNLKC